MSARNDKLFDIILEEAFDKYAEDIANEKIPCNMTDKEASAMEQQKQRVYNNVKKRIRAEKRPHRIKTVRRIFVIAAAVAALLAAAMSVSAFRVFVYKTYTDIKGTVLQVNTGKITDEDYDVITRFEPKEEIIVPGWLPADMEIDQIQDYETNIFIAYYDDKGIGFSISEVRLPVETDGGIETENNTVKIEDCTVMGMPGKIVYVQSEIGNESYSVYWCSDNVEYMIDTNYPRITLDTILQNLKYLKK